MYQAKALHYGKQSMNKCFVLCREIPYRVTPGMYPLEVEYIRESPVNKAINTCFRKAEEQSLDWFIIMGADTIHYTNSIAQLLPLLNDTTWSVMGMLKDYFRGDGVYGNHVYNGKIMRGYRVDETDPLYDHKIHEDMEIAGYKKSVGPVIGVHHPTWTVEEAFKKFFFSGWRYGDKDYTFLRTQVINRFEENPHPVTQAAYDALRLGRERRDKPVPTLTFNLFDQEWKDYQRAIGDKANSILIWQK